MKISKNLIIKGSAGAAAATAVTTCAVYGENIANFFETGSFIIEDIAGKRKSLGLPDECKWPEKVEDGILTCDLTAEQLKAINFDGKDKEITVTGGNSAVLTMEKVQDASIFNRGYKFILKSKDDDVTIKLSSKESIVLKKDIDLEFRIKEVEEKWYLEKAWNVGTIAKDIGLNCKNKNDCVLSDKGKINIELGDKKISDVTQLKTSTSAKIKLQEGVKGYYQGLKFSIEDGDFSLGSGKERLERDESYEIKQEGNKWFLSRKVSTAEIINKRINGLGLPDTCKWQVNSFSDFITCELDKDKLENINFDGKGRDTLTATNAEKATLKIERDKDTKAFPGGVKIIFENTQEVTVNKNGASFINWKEGTNTEYKIKGSGDSKTLEKAWKNAGDLAKKVGINQCSNESCILVTSPNVRDGNKTTYERNLKDSLKEIKYEENQAGYNQGFKFTPKEDISFISGSPVEKLERGASYEIKELVWKEKKSWFLVKKAAPAA